MANRQPESKKLRCPICGGITWVTDTRGNEETVYRKRRCQECGYKFGTIEIDLDLYQKLTSSTQAK